MDLLGAGLTPLVGGHSGETFLAEAAGERSVVRIYAGRGASRGSHAAEVDAAVLRLVRGLLPVPQVLEVRRADAAAGTPGLLVTSFLAGRRLDEVLAGAPPRLATTFGENLGVLVARLAQMPQARPGLFLDADLRIGPMPPGGDDLEEWIRSRLADRSTALSGWPAADQEALLDLARHAQELADDVTRACLVHSDLNPKNVLVDPETGDVTGLLDWEFAHAGSPLTDLGNLLRFERDPSFTDAVLATYAHLVPDAPDRLEERAAAADLWALVDLAARAGENPVATRAHDLLLARTRAGDLAGR